MNPIPDNITMVAECVGVTPCQRYTWEVEMHIGTDAMCFHITGPQTTPPDIELAWEAAQCLVAKNPSMFPDSFRPTASAHPVNPIHPVKNSRF
jgi:hypothetical protein